MWKLPFFLLTTLHSWGASTPNIVLFYADDLGYTDLACQGSKYYETPNLDRLAKEGMRFTQAYASAANCAPSRASLMTGQYTPIHQVDLFPSLVSLADGKVDSSLDGLNILPALKGEALPERPLFWHFPAYLQGYSAGNGSASQHFRTTPCGVIRKGDWNLIEYFEDNRAELYNLKNDLSEKNNLASKKPEKVKELLAELKAWQKKTKAPIPTEKNPKFRP